MKSDDKVPTIIGVIIICSFIAVVFPILLNFFFDNIGVIAVIGIVIWIGSWGYKKYDNWQNKKRK